MATNDKPGAKRSGKQAAASKTGPLDDILGTLLGGSQPEPSTSQTAKPKPKPKPSASQTAKPKPSTSQTAKPKPKPTQPAAQAAPDLGGLLQTFLGGGAQPQPAGSQISTGPLAPLVDMLAKKLNLPPAIAGMVITFVLGKLLSSQGRSLGSSTDLVQELAQQTGLDPETSSKSLTAALDILGRRAGGT